MKQYLLLFFLFLTSCVGKQDLQTLEWKKGSSSSLSDLSAINFSRESKLQSGPQTVVFREQEFSDIPIENSFLKTVKNHDGEDLQIRGAVSFDHEKLQKLPLNSFKNKRDVIGKELEAAFPIFRRHKPESIEIIIAHRRGFYEPLWKVIYSDNKGASWEVRVNNHLQVQSVKRVGSQFHDTVAVIFPKGPKRSGLQEIVLKDLNIQPTLSNSRLFVGSQAEEKIGNVRDPLKFSIQDARFDQVQVFFFLEESLSWFERKLNFKIPFQLHAEVHVGAPEKTNSAFYYQGKIRIGAGDDETYSRIPQDPSIVIHESVHALVDAIAKLPFEGEGGSLNEGFADFFTALQLGSPNMGESAYLKGPFRRSLVNDFKLSGKTGGLYHDSGIVSGALWDLSTRFGSEQGIKIGILTLNCLVPSSDFKDFGNCLNDILPEVFVSAEDLATARMIVEARGF
ncbi:MAG: hypothetical protein HUU57_09310 [Bdellovibrio sp.]|nr:hypothetical protein [Bdellovibrio sp.]